MRWHDCHIACRRCIPSSHNWSTRDSVINIRNIDGTTNHLLRLKYEKHCLSMRKHWKNIWFLCFWYFFVGKIDVWGDIYIFCSRSEWDNYSHVQRRWPHASPAIHNRILCSQAGCLQKDRVKKSRNSWRILNIFRYIQYIYVLTIAQNVSGVVMYNIHRHAHASLVACQCMWHICKRSHIWQID